MILVALELTAIQDRQGKQITRGGTEIAPCAALPETPISQSTLVRIGSFKKLEEAKMAVELFFKPGNGKAAGA